MQTRRNFLKLAAMLSGAAGASSLIPDSIQRAYAIEPESGSTYLDAEHIVILMQENRSFDHALGSLQGVRGFNDPRAIRLANGNSVFVQTDASGNSYAPWRLDIRDTRATWMGSIPHSRNSQVDAWNEGHHDGWLEAKRSGHPEYAPLPLTMGHYTREDLPFYYALADAFTVCDQHYCSVMTSTTPNRSTFWTGTVRDEQRAFGFVERDAEVPLFVADLPRFAVPGAREPDCRLLLIVGSRVVEVDRRCNVRSEVEHGHRNELRAHRARAQRNQKNRTTHQPRTRFTTAMTSSSVMM